jgi:hypothetical protein
MDQIRLDLRFSHLLGVGLCAVEPDDAQDPVLITYQRVKNSYNARERLHAR